MENQSNLERYGHIRAWADELGISTNAITVRLKTLTGITGKLVMGRVLEDGFFAESDIRRACADILEENIQSDDSGFLMHEGVRYATINRWSRALGISAKAIGLRLNKNLILGMTAKDQKGQVCEHGFFAEIDIRRACADLLTSMHQANSEGFIQAENNRYGSVTAWSKVLSIDPSDIQIRLKEAEITGLTAKDAAGHVLNNGFFLEEDVRQACAILHQDIPKSDASGLLIFEGEEHGTKLSWSKRLGIDRPSIALRLRGIKGITAKNSLGRVIEHGFYSASIIQERCADLMENLPRCDDSGFFVIDGERYAAKSVWGKAFGIGMKQLNRRIENIVAIDGRTASGNILQKNFYAEGAVRAACSDLLSENLPCATDTDFLLLEHEGTMERHATSGVWGNLFGMKAPTLSVRLRNYKGVRAKNRFNQIAVFYPESVVRDVCKDLLSSKKTNGAE